MLGLIVLLTILGSLADLARRQEHHERQYADRHTGPAATPPVP
ncbi:MULTISPECIES: hypothetical protein [Deinococcus]|uniref:Uncharacterized protein n=1 Tax=Deinococcus rufus TaxID=2136097 RepID=A0ABV7ZED3_9DEIO|nr:hypothetical protein [Deinococcus sp. AB2017081]WQE96928.1 hypothetical protein U2P90_08500 [Deinococcus sp. AB2017081]